LLPVVAAAALEVALPSLSLHLFAINKTQQ